MVCTMFSVRALGVSLWLAGDVADLLVAYGAQVRAWVVANLSSSFLWGGWGPRR